MWPMAWGGAVAAATARIGRTKDLRMAWRYGGASERRLVLLVFTAPLVVFVAFVIGNAYLLVAQLDKGALFQVNLVIIMAAASWYMFQPAITTPMYSNDYYREAIRQRWLSPLQGEWAAEIVRFREAHGVNGQMPSNLGLGLAYGAVYDAGVIGSVPFGIALYPVLGGWTWMAFAVWYIPLVVVLRMAFWRRMKKEADAAAEMGFRMREIASKMRLELQRERRAENRRS